MISFRHGEAMRHKAPHDALTSLLSRGAILDLPKRELARKRRQNGCKHFSALRPQWIVEFPSCLVPLGCRTATVGSQTDGA
jgi:hypothetical protein